MKSWLLAAAVLSIAACATAPASTSAPEPAARVTLDPVGVYDFSTTADGTAVTGAVTITRGEAGYGGAITTNVTEPVPIGTVTVEGTRIILLSMTPDGPLTFTMDFAGDDFSGTWTLGEMSGTHTGKRRTP